MVSPNTENKDHDDGRILNGGVAFGDEVAKESDPMDDANKLVPEIGDMSINTTALDHGPKCYTNTSNSSNSSNSGVDSYNADCSGGSDDQSSDDTSGKMRVKGAILMNVASARHKSNSGKHSDSASSSCSSGGRNCEAASNLSSKKDDGTSFWKETSQQVTNASPLLPSTSNSPATFPQRPSVLSRTDPVEPRIDLSIVNSIPSSALLLPLHETARAALFEGNASASTGTGMKNGKPSSVLSSESYHHLLEAVRPFFQAQGLLPSQANQHELTYTVLTAESRRAESSTKNSSSEGFTAFFTTTDDSRNQILHSSNRAAAKECDSVCADLSSDDNSSMAVLSYPKKKHNASKHQQETILSSSNDGQRKGKSHEHHRPALSHRVTDVSSSNPSNTTSGSGSGDNGANTTGSGSGTGSNHGSSGSGNENGKGSSEEVAKDDSNSGGDGTNISDGSATPQDFKHRNQNRGSQGNAEMPEETSMLSLENQHGFMSVEMEDKVNMASNTREQKLLDKKRKRIVMRREYEAQQASTTSSESSSDATEDFIQPGQPVTLDEVLVFSKIPRIIVQGLSPYLIVHKNAACCRLTGIDAHLVVGKPISTLMSVLINNDVKLSNAVSKCNFGSSKQHQEGPYTSVNLDDTFAYKANHKKSKNTLNKIISTSGLGKMHGALLHTKQQKQMVGQNVTIEHNKSYSKQQSEDSNDTSLTSNSDRKKTAHIPEKDIPAIFCQISVAPIVMSTSRFEKHESTKRARPSHQIHDSFYDQLEATHFVIQIAPWNAFLEKGNAPVFSSNSSDEQKKHNDMKVNQDDNIESLGGGSVSLQSSDHEAIVAIG